MGLLARRFLNLIVPGCSPGVKSLRRIDLTRQRLFYQVGSPPPPALEMETIRFADPSFTFRASNNEWKMDCFPLADYSESKVICADHSGRGFFFDLDSAMVGTIPTLRAPKVMPISIFVHKPHVDANLRIDSKGSSLFLMEKVPQPEVRRRASVQQESEQFVGFINRRNGLAVTGKSWHCHLLPPPPFVRETAYHWSNNKCLPEITAYGVVGGGSHVCISVEGGVGTYCLDTESLLWNKVGDWTLPFHGKIEYVPQLKLWFGFGLSTGARRHCLAAADLSGMLDSSSSSQPQRLVGGPWKELVHLPEEWKECRDPQFVSLGSGRFCIARFFSQEAEAGDQVAVLKNFTVLTGVEINTSSGKGGTGKLELQMTTHISRRVNNTSIEILF
ncbi:hypothetical protein BDA96_10G339900 [Sorghum bicolor]|uniref:Uncharacterized protein n=2 Tax=Sorghum bicolor TaxID=4558 RepID=A0A921U2V4_SORBI|nr:hypothetical protein BDA96_10G339900 [Sorghum bicolor]KXG20862.1 hypothetical protein SORBI_3010G263300 [Sorghum bicolor]